MIRRTQERGSEKQACVGLSEQSVKDGLIGAGPQSKRVRTEEKWREGEGGRAAQKEGEGGGRAHDGRIQAHPRRERHAPRLGKVQACASATVGVSRLLALRRCAWATKTEWWSERQAKEGGGRERATRIREGSAAFRPRGVETCRLITALETRAREAKTTKKRPETAHAHMERHASHRRSNSTLSPK